MMKISRTRVHAAFLLLVLALEGLPRAHAQASVRIELFAKSLASNVTPETIRFVDFKQDDDFNAYLESLAKFDPSSLKIAIKPDATPEERKDDARYERRRMIAFWANAYNALALKTIADHYSDKLRSVRQIRDFYTKPVAEVAGKPRSLREIEDIIRRLKEPRAVFLLYRGIAGGPQLSTAPVTAVDLEAEIDSAMTDFFHHRGNYQLDTLGKLLWLPDFLEPYEKDFGGSEAMLRTFSRYLRVSRDRRFISENISVRYREADSGLQPRVSKPGKERQ